MLPVPFDIHSHRTRNLARIVKHSIRYRGVQLDRDVGDTSTLTHLNDQGEAHMVDVGHKLPTVRVATATSTLLFSESTTYTTLTSYDNKKGDAIAVARVAAILAAKKTPDLIPLAHPSLFITSIEVDLKAFSGEERAYSSTVHREDSRTSRLQSRDGGITVTATVSCEGKTGVEMETLTAVSIGAATLYDMLKGIDKGMVITNTRVIEKKGGKSGDWRWDDSTNQLVRLVPPNSDAFETQKVAAQCASDSAPESRTTATGPVTQVTHVENVETAQPVTSDIDEWNARLAREFSMPTDTSDTPATEAPAALAKTQKQQPRRTEAFHASIEKRTAQPSGQRESASQVKPKASGIKPVSTSNNGEKLNSPLSNSTNTKIARYKEHLVRLEALQASGIHLNRAQHRFVAAGQRLRNIDSHEVKSPETTVVATSDQSSASEIEPNQVVTQRPAMTQPNGTPLVTKDDAREIGGDNTRNLHDSHTTPPRNPSQLPHLRVLRINSKSRPFRHTFPEEPQINTSHPPRGYGEIYPRKVDPFYEKWLQAQVEEKVQAAHERGFDMSEDEALNSLVAGLHDLEIEELGEKARESSDAGDGFDVRALRDMFSGEAGRRVDADDLRGLSAERELAKGSRLDPL
ncbi:hypothetical protein LTR66_013956 [Elasticomyces elasticus]|nr:hypothetical protein LTR66_013956 [Elasticomyces elasticus]